MSATFETPAELRGRLKLGREEFCQRLLTSLIIRGRYPRWNTRSSISESGVTFLTALYRLSFGDPWPPDPAVFVDELELLARSDAEKGGAPDWAVLWDGRVWIIELKTEKASHRPQQIPYYFELARHHFPTSAVEITYVTPPGTARNHVPADARYAHVTWQELSPLIASTWGSAKQEDERSVVEGVLELLEHLHLRPADWSGDVAEPSPAIAEGLRASEQDTDSAPKLPTTPRREGPLAEALELAQLTASDGVQRAIDFPADSLEDLLDLRLAVREQLASTESGSPLRRVVPWLWRHKSGGRPMTSTGADRGFELRLSRYAGDRYRLRVR